MNRWFWVFAGLLGSAACRPPTYAIVPPTAASTIAVAVPSDISGESAIYSRSTADSNVYVATSFPGIDFAFDCSLQARPGLYESWEWSPDHRELALTLRRGVRWSDGTRVVADDVVLTYEMIADPRCGSARYQYTTAFEHTPVAEGRRTVRFAWKKPAALDRRLAEVSAYHLPRSSLAYAFAECSAALGEEPVPVDGPFRLADRQPGVSYTLEPNPAFSGPASMRPRLGQVRFEVIPEYQNRLRALIDGRVHVMEGVRVPDLDALRAARPDLQVHRRGLRFMDFVAWNLSDPRFSDVRVRRAMAMAVDVQGIMRALLGTEDGTLYGQQAVGTISPEHCDVRPDVDVLPFDRQAARALLAEAGWEDSDDDGIVDRDGQPFRFVLLTNRENLRRRAAVRLIADQLALVGIEVETGTRPFSDLMDRLRRRDFDAVLNGWAAGLFIDPTSMWHSGPEGSFNYPGLADPEVDALIERGRSLPDAASAAPIWKDVQAQVYAQQPYLFLWWRDEVVAVDGRLRGTHIGLKSTFQDLEQWRLDP